MKHFRLVIVLSIAIIAGLHCSHPSQPTTGLGNQYSIYLTGRVLDKNGNPMTNAVAKLADKNLADTTGADGYYYITEKKANGVSKIATASVGDSLQILKAGQVITYLDIPKWIDTLPDVFLIQRDIYGSLSPAPTSISRITATITGDSIPDSLAQVAVLGYIPATGNYSGFIYFVYTAQTLNYNVYVSVYNADTALIGRSMIVTFPSTAGDISMPTFNPNNATPVVYAGDDTTVSINDMIRLHATASDSFGGHIAKWEWNIGNSGFRQTATGDTIIIAPADSDSLYICVVRVTDNKGFTSVDSMTVDVVLDPPIAYAGNDTTVDKNSQVTLHGSATQEFGTIVKWEWNINNSGFVQTSAGDTTITTPDNFINVYPCILRVTDDDGQTGEDTVNVQVGIEWRSLGNGITNGFGDVRAIAFDKAGNLFAGGGFTEVDTIPAIHIAKWDGGSWSALGNGIGNGINDNNSWVLALAVDSSGNLYAGGEFSMAGGATANNIAKWDGNSWSTLGTGMNNQVIALVVDKSGNLYAGGYFDSAGGVAVNNIAKWDGNSWNALGTGTDNMVCTLLFDNSGNLYAGGAFATAGGVTTNAIAKWDGNAWSAFGSGMSGGNGANVVYALAVDDAGNLYAGGNFNAVSGVAANNITKWNGSAWNALGSGMGGGTVNALVVDKSGNLYAGGGFTTAGGVATSYIAEWDGSSWNAIENGQTGCCFYTLAFDKSGNFYAGGNFAGVDGVPAGAIAEGK